MLEKRLPHLVCQARRCCGPHPCTLSVPCCTGRYARPTAATTASAAGSRPLGVDATRRVSVHGPGQPP